MAGRTDVSRSNVDSLNPTHYRPSVSSLRSPFRPRRRYTEMKKWKMIDTLENVKSNWNNKNKSEQWVSAMKQSTNIMIRMKIDAVAIAFIVVGFV